MSSTKSIRVLFLPGLESGPRGIKARFLKKHFTSESVDFEVSLWKPRRNGILRNYLTNAMTLGLAGSAAAVGVVFGSWVPVLGGGALLALLLNGTLTKKVLGGIVEDNILRASLLIDSHKPDVVVASSWGGAIAGYLIERELWLGPTVLLAPAYSRLRRKIEGEAIPPNMPTPAHVQLYHAPRDDTINFSDSEALMATWGPPRCELVSVDDTHRLNKMLEGEEESALYHAVLKAANHRSNPSKL
eukprot:PhF_6_TR19962/c0_g1_i1/m.29098